MALLLSLVACAAGKTLPSHSLGAACSFEQVAERPRLFRCKNFADEEWVAALIEEAEAELAPVQCKEKKCRSYLNSTEGFASRPALAAFVESLYHLLPAEAAADARSNYGKQPLNLLKYLRDGETLGWHTDPQKNSPSDLIATAILYLRQPAKGGETAWSRSEPAPVMVPPEPGSLALFISCDKWGDDEEKGLHKGMRVLDGEKLALEKFFALPRWFCAQDFTFESKGLVTIAETAEAAKSLKEEGAVIGAARTVESKVCRECLDSGQDYCAAWDKCIPRCQRACARADHVTGCEPFAKKGFSTICPTGDQLTKGQKYLEAKAHESGVTKHPSGLLTRVLRPGHGLSTPSASSICKMHYRLQLIDGTQIASTYEKEATVGPCVADGSIKGFNEAVQMMVEGAQWTVYVPSDLAYADRGAGGVIPAHAALVFSIELLEVQAKTDL